MSDAAISPLDKDARIAELEAALAVRDTLIETLRLQLSQLRRMTFGQSSEKLALQIAQLELALERARRRGRGRRRAQARSRPLGTRCTSPGLACPSAAR